MIVTDRPEKNEDGGFSLVELIIVIAIMALLIGLLAPQFVKYIERSRKSADIQNVAELVRATEAFCMNDENSALVVDGVYTFSMSNTLHMPDPVHGNVIDKALADTGPGGVQLKSKDWTDPKGGTLELTLTISAGVLEFSVSGERTGVDILEGKF
ncbi:MAG: prepilin-type N-terminal cleavage/methylation domain-containing protein [Lachnospiraceae bacterium]|nr:prepilin-type N-terminal cleavage/methylation domain-containing protein [Lachnospiraceae bacterium]